MSTTITTAFDVVDDLLGITHAHPPVPVGISTDEDLGVNHRSTDVQCKHESPDTKDTTRFQHVLPP